MIKLCWNIECFTTFCHEYVYKLLLSLEQIGNTEETCSIFWGRRNRRAHENCCQLRGVNFQHRKKSGYEYFWISAMCTSLISSPPLFLDVVCWFRVSDGLLLQNILEDAEYGRGKLSEIRGGRQVCMYRFVYKKATCKSLKGKAWINMLSVLPLKWFLVS